MGESEGEEIEEVNKFKYLGVMISANVGMEKEMVHRTLQGRNVRETMIKLWKENMIP